jgi:tRNA ligase
MPPQICEEDSQLVADLYKLSAKAPKLVKSSTYSAPAAPDITVSSWKMSEFRYYDVPSPFPTLARGLFTTEETAEGGEKKYRIVARGYDKFFNIGEVPWTTVSAEFLGRVNSSLITD